ncbi:DinB family protein [Streptomyces sp. NPDC051561]|uniref:DinB family protein n=1 Tax=Streptomyces sp. NPDC051561 TaxID=3365658 RepID=UPI0037913DB1
MPRHTDMPPAWDERSTLTTFLDYARGSAIAKCADLAPEHVGAALLPSSPLTTMGGLISHLRWVEKSWFEEIFLGHGDDIEWPWTDEDPDREMRLGARTPMAQLVAEYETQSEQYRKLVAETDLDARSAKPFRNGEHPTMRWILMHLVEEISRHNGHLDALRELADGQTGR